MTEAKAAKKALKEEKRIQKREAASKRLLNKFFHHIDRGSTLGREVSGGILMCILSVCGIFMNMQLVQTLLVSGPAAEAAAADITANGEVITSFYFFSMVAAFLGSLLMGFVARIPLVQIPSLGLSTVLISTFGIGSGLTYQNLLFLCFISAIIYTVLMVVPAVRNTVLNAIPKSVRRAAPAAVGVILIFTMLQMTGIVQLGSSPLAIKGVNSAAINMKKWTGLLNENTYNFNLFDYKTYNSLAYKGDAFFPWIQTAMLGVAAVFIAFLLLRKTKHPVLYALLIGTGVYYAGYLSQVVFYVNKSGALQFELDSLWGRLWMVGSEDAQHLHLSLILQNFSFGSMLKEGADFSAYTEAGGNVTFLYVSAILTFLFMNISFTEASASSGESADEKELGRSLICNAGINLVAPLLGISAVAVDPSSVAAKRDGARSGIASIVAAIGMLISAFIWLIPFLFCTTTSYDIVFNLYGHYGTVIQLMTECSFLVADGVMALVGFLMLANAIRDGFNNAAEQAAFSATVAGALFLSNLAVGVALGIIVYFLANIFDRDRSISIGNGAAALVSIALVAFSFVL